jgi:N-acetylglucosaminyldiphosphoundecaprenol N-acetyl-beta-D-mannosaminyltransferase
MAGRPRGAEPAMANVFGFGVHAVAMEQTIELMRQAVDDGRKGYICLAGAHGIMEARRNAELRRIADGAFLILPDGTPTVWIGRSQGHAGMRRVFGPELMLEVIGRRDLSHIRHYLCGGDEGTAEALKAELLRRFPWANVCGTFTPPFRPMTLEEECLFATQVGDARTDIVWVGLGTPKQERFMAQYLPMLKTKLMVGVGAAFLFHTGAISDSPQWIKRAGLQWFHRLLQEPRRLWRRYLINVPLFGFHAILQGSGLRRYELTDRKGRVEV